MTLDEHIQGMERERAYRARFAAIHALLQDHNPLGMAKDRPTEYLPETQTIVPRLDSARSVEDVRRIVYEEVARWRGADMAGPLENYDAIVAEVWEIAQRHPLQD